jgi:Iap family predicted aminopeptidase
LFAEDLAERGAAGLVVVSGAQEGWVAHLNALMYPALAAPDSPDVLPIPGVTIEREAAKRLLTLMSLEKRTLRVAHRASYPTVTTGNVVGELPGRDPSSYVVVGAHYDTQLEGVGASDNATGVASLVAIARRFAEGNPPLRTLRFAAFADEEGGFQGSVSYCRRHAESVNAMVGMINLDALGWWPSQRSLDADPGMLAFAAESARSYGWEPDHEGDASLFPGSDHNPFIDAGVPSAFFWRHPPTHPYYHTAGDRPEILDYRVVTETASVAAFTLNRLGNEEILDLGRSQPTRRWLDLRP